MVSLHAIKNNAQKYQTIINWQLQHEYHIIDRKTVATMLSVNTEVHVLRLADSNHRSARTCKLSLGAVSTIYKDTFWEISLTSPYPFAIYKSIL